MTPSSQHSDELMLQAYGDGELDATEIAALERRLATDAALRRRHDQLRTLRTSLRRLPAEAIPGNLEARIKSSIDARRPIRRWPWRALAACMVIGALVGSAATLVVDRSQPGNADASAIVGNHLRGLLAPQPFDVASSDRHTVKPWFAARVPASPKVPDLAAVGFALAGGRIDVVDWRPVPTIIYKHATHLVSVTVLSGDQTIADMMIAGYHVVSWHDDSLTYVAVSDLPQTELTAFQQAFVAAAKPL
jgi:anti-sigma factor RsiW